ncbi:uncharacterized protein lrrc75a isoform X2 [Channa argus]|uniref:uncharacterized protein lrrc75a isoform X2 n=1 Tax=Channa argus TaxID=215402 RepID=UPI0035223AA6
MTKTIHRDILTQYLSSVPSYQCYNDKDTENLLRSTKCFSISGNLGGLKRQLHYLFFFSRFTPTQQPLEAVFSQKVLITCCALPGQHQTAYKQSLKAVLSAAPSSGALDLSGLPLTARDMERLCAHLQRHASIVVSLELGFSELTDEAFLLLLPTLAALPHLETLALNGNRLTRAILKELTDALKDPGSFPSVTWIDLGNNVDIFSLPQPFLVSLRKRCPKQGNLPTILEFGESQASDPPERLKGLEEEEETDDTNRTESMGELRSEVEEEMDGEMEIEEMMEELLDFDREVQGKEDEEESMWTVEEQRKAGRESKRREGGGSGEREEQNKEQRPGRRPLMAEDEDDTQSRSSHLSYSSQSQHSSGAVEPMKVEEDDLTDLSDHLT